MAVPNQNVTLEGVRIGFRNFAGVEKRYNRAGKRNFCVFLNEEDGEELLRQGWNVRWLAPSDEYETRSALLSVSVAFGNLPPKIVLISSQGKTLLDEETIGMLDWADLSNVDLIIRPYNWEMNGRTGVAAYVKTMYVTLQEDPLERKYSDQSPHDEPDDVPF